MQNHAIFKSPVLKHLIGAGELKVVTAMYHLGSGEVESLKTDSSAPAGMQHKHGH